MRPRQSHLVDELDIQLNIHEEPEQRQIRLCKQQVVVNSRAVSFSSLAQATVISAEAMCMPLVS